MEANKVVTQDLKIGNSISIKDIDWIIDPIQSDMMQEKMRNSPSFAESMMKDKTNLFFEYLHHKPAWREPVTLEISGQTRSGKSTLGTGICKYLHRITTIPFGLQNICPTETIYLDKIKKLNAPDQTPWQVDEQQETHAGAGSYTEMQLIEDLNNIIAKRCYHTVWIHPTDFVGRGGQLGLTMWGKNPELKLLRAILYNTGGKKLSNNVPMGVIIFPIGWLFPCGQFGKSVRHMGLDTVITCNKAVCPNYATCEYFMGQYEHQKDEKINQLVTQDIHDRENARLEVIEHLAMNEPFQNCKNNDERMAIARYIVPFGTPEKLIREFVAVAKSVRISTADLRATQERNVKDIEKVE